MSLSDLLQTWRATPAIARNITAWRTFPGQVARSAPFPDELHHALAQALHEQGINTLYTHQAEAWEHVQAGRHPVIVTGTASGKTLGYNLPVLHHLLSDSAACALYLFPTKALAHDQLTIIKEQFALDDDSLTVSSYDGDTPQALRPAIRNQARIVLTNPDMLHAGILPHHTRWARFFSHLRFVVLDEMHIYRGVFGSHLANVVRRLKRIARFYSMNRKGTGRQRPMHNFQPKRQNLQFILTSATIANPAELAERLIEESVALVDEDGAAKGPKHIIIYNPPLVNPDLGVRRGVLQESVRLTRELLDKNIQTITFVRTRRATELLLTYLRDQLTINNPEPGTQDTVRAYRSGYLPRQRREIEQGLRTGRVQAVVATSALELGIDIGGMTAAVLAGYPGTIAGTWQQAGRAGRKNEEALALLITSAGPLDQFLAHHPDYFFDRSPEQALINPDNLLILLQHLRCAAFELPFKTGDGFGRVEPALLGQFLQFLQDSGDLHLSGGQYFWMADRYPAEQVSLRSASPQKVLLQTRLDDRLAIIGEVDRPSAPWMVHPQAVYLHEGRSYLVDSLDLEQGLAQLRPANVDYYTEARQETQVQLVSLADQARTLGAQKFQGELMVTTRVTGYRMLKFFTNHHLGNGQVDLPPSDLHTTGYWLVPSPETVDALREQGLWTNDPNDYGPNWQEQRKRARARDGYRCQLCGAPEQGRQHDVHHKVPFRTFNDFRQANRLDNLVTLCRTCHRRAETAVRLRSGLSGLATVLGHLAPLFLMCDTHDVGLHADPQSPLAEGQPVVVIYDMVPAGIGFSQRLFEQHAQLVHHAYALVAGCGCADGCPSCVGPPGEEGYGGKQETLALLQRLSAGG